MNRRAFALAAGLILTLVPAAVRAEVSVLVDSQGRVKRVVYLNRGFDRKAVVWKQVRGRIPLETMLNPLGDTTGDLAPAIAVHPATGQPWVVWPRNEGNQKRLVFSTWNGSGWTEPQRVAQPDIMGWDQVEPRLLFDPSGTPYLFFTEAARNGRILFTTLSRGVWTPPLAVSDEKIDSRAPAATLQGPSLRITWATPGGPVTKLLPTTTLLEDATNLMDSPIPPGSTTTPSDPTPPGGQEEPDDQLIFPHR